jgi:hypothetical protein
MASLTHQKMNVLDVSTQCLFTLVPHRAWPDLQRMKILLPLCLCRRHRGRCLLGAIKPAF